MRHDNDITTVKPRFIRWKIRPFAVTRYRLPIRPKWTYDREITIRHFSAPLIFERVRDTRW